MFSTGQVYFAIFFVIAFTIALIFTYKKDIKQLQKQYKGTIWIFVSFILFVLFLFLIKRILKL